MTAAAPVLRANPVDIVRGLGMFYTPGEVFEVRLLGGRFVASGYFDAPEKAAAALTAMNGRAYRGAYVTVNPPLPALLSRAANRINPHAACTTGDKDIVCRRVLYLDFDPNRPSGISATDAEHAAAIEVAQEAVFDLGELGFPGPGLVDTGNGGYAAYRLPDLPNNAESDDLIKRVLEACAQRFNTATVKVDLSVHNAARIARIPGLPNRKGDNTIERPWRMAKPLHIPQVMESAPRELLLELASSVAPPRPHQAQSRPHGEFRIEDWIRRHGLAVREPVPHEGGRKLVLDECPFNADHKAPDAAIFEAADGRLGFKCFHDSCSAYGWRELRERFEGPRANPNGAQREKTSNAQRPPMPDAGSLLIQRVSDIEPQPVRWLWPKRIARGKVTMFAGNPGLGKGHITSHITAVVTTGTEWPDGASKSAPRNVIILSGEDDAADTLRPRLTAAGADLSRVHVIESVIAGYTGEGQQLTRLFNLQRDLEALSKALDEIKDVALIVVDPITCFLGDTDSHRNAEVRAVLAPLAQLGAKHSAALVCISHLNKAGGSEALMRVTGSLAFTAAARAAYLAVKDPNDESRRLFLPMKNNLAREMPGLAYSIEDAVVEGPDGPIETSRVRWCPEPVEITADEVLKVQRPADGTALREAKEWLQGALEGDDQRADELIERASAVGVAKRTLQRAADALGVVKTRLGMTSHWFWSLPGRTPKSTPPEGANSPSEDAKVGTFDQTVESKAKSATENHEDAKSSCVGTFGGVPASSPEDAKTRKVGTFGGETNANSHEINRIVEDAKVGTFGLGSEEGLAPSDDDFIEVIL